MRQHLKVFISSPADVPAERLRADLICDKISQDYGRVLTLETYRWEHEPMLASGHFQDAIEPPSRADIVLLILWSRLGTPLPERTGAREYRGIDGRAPVTGTEWEFEDALASARSRGAPDILVFRNVSPAPIDPRDPEARARSLEQLEALDAFWKRHFTDRGVFLAAFGEYRTIDEFAARLEESMRKLIERRVQAAAPSSAAAAPLWSSTPFRGLEPYEFEHASIFFGRDALVAKAAEQLAARARAGTAFLLISGASGSGKSSLAKAALIPRLMKPQRISGAAFLRRAVFRPGDARPDVFRGLVDALVTPNAIDVGLRELVGAGQNAEELARHLRVGVDDPGYAFAGALGRLSEQARASGRMLGYEEAKLILLVDQLEELFTSDQISEDDRRLFVRLLAGLARSGHVWVAATMRADFWHRAVLVPELIALSEGAGRIEIPPPGAAELAEIIRKPAAAAGIGFQTHPETRIGLDALIAEHAAAGPGVLPLLSFTLEALYAEDILKRGGRELTYRTYEALGGLEGAIATRAEAVVSEMPERARAAVPRVLRALTTVDWGTEHGAVARAAPLSGFAPGGDARTAVDALTAARLLVASGESGEARVRLAHEALIGRWQRAKAQLVVDRRDLETRALVERQLARWRAATGSARAQLHLRDPDLANAVDLERRWGNELDQDIRAFIAGSRQRARRRQRMVGAAAAVFAAVALTASVLGVVAYRSQQRAENEWARAERNFEAAKDAVDSLIFDVAQGLRDVEGLRVATIGKILGTVERAVEQLLEQSQGDLRVENSRISMLDEFATTYLHAGDLQRAAAAAEQALALARQAAAKQPENPRWRRGIWIGLNRTGLVKSLAGDAAGALQAYTEGLAIGRRLAEHEPQSPHWKRELSVSLNLIGDLKLNARDLGGARAAYEEAYELLRAAPTGDVTWQHDVSVSFGKVGEVKRRGGDVAGALKAFTEMVEVRRRLAAADPDNTALQSSLATALERLGDVKRDAKDNPGARAAAEETLAIMRRLVARDPAQTGWQRGLALTLLRIGLLAQLAGEHEAAAAALDERLEINRRLAAQDLTNAQAQWDLWIAFKNVALLRAKTGDVSGALTAYQGALEVGHRLLQRNRDNRVWLDELWWTLDVVGGLKTEMRDPAGAAAAYIESVDVGRRLAALDPADTRTRASLAVALYKLGETKRKAGDKDGARAAFSESLMVVEKLEQERRLSDEQRDWPKVLRKAIADLDTVQNR